jgi:hypothetical protein
MACAELRIVLARKNGGAWCSNAALRSSASINAGMPRLNGDRIVGGSVSYFTRRRIGTIRMRPTNGHNQIVTIRRVSHTASPDGHCTQTGLCRDVPLGVHGVDHPGTNSTWIAMPTLRPAYCPDTDQHFSPNRFE